MGVMLFKKLVVLNEGKNDERKFYTFYIKLQNGSTLRVQPNSWKDSKGIQHSNYNELCLIACDELPFDK